MRKTSRCACGGRYAAVHVERFGKRGDDRWCEATYYQCTYCGRGYMSMVGIGELPSESEMDAAMRLLEPEGEKTADPSMN